MIYDGMLKYKSHLSFCSMEAQILVGRGVKTRRHLEIALKAGNIHGPFSLFASDLLVWSSAIEDGDAGRTLIKFMD